MKELHEVSGHVGATKMYGLLRQHYFWPSLLQDCVSFVSKCVHC